MISFRILDKVGGACVCEDFVVPAEMHPDRASGLKVKTHEPNSRDAHSSVYLFLRPSVVSVSSFHASLPLLSHFSSFLSHCDLSFSLSSVPLVSHLSHLSSLVSLSSFQSLSHRLPISDCDIVANFQTIHHPFQTASQMARSTRVCHKKVLSSRIHLQ